MSTGSAWAKMKPHLLNAGFNLFFAYQTYKDDQKEHPHASTLSHLVKGAATYAAWELPMLKPIMWAGDISEMARVAGGALVNAYYRGDATRRHQYMGNFGGRFEDTDLKATMRQRGLAAIQQSRLNARTILGSEARALQNGWQY